MLKKNVWVPILALAALASCQGAQSSLSSVSSDTTTSSVASSSSLSSEDPVSSEKVSSSTPGDTSADSSTDSSSSSPVVEVKTTTLDLKGPSVLALSDSAQLEVAYDAGATVTLSFESSDDTVLSVGSDGLVQGLKVGSATVTVTDSLSGLKDTLTIAVVEGVPELQTLDDVKQFLTDRSAALESSIGKIQVKETSTGGYYGDTETVTTYSKYGENFIMSEELGGEEKDTSIYAIKNNYLYNVEFGSYDYVSKRAIAQGETAASDEVTLAEAKEDVADMDVTSDLLYSLPASYSLTAFDVSTSKDGEDVLVTGQGYYLRVWANNENADYTDYSLSIRLSGAGLLKSFTFLSQEYSDSSYDVIGQKLKEDATVETTEKTEYEILDPYVLDEKDIPYDVDDYFMTEITGAGLKNGNTIAVGDSIAAYDIEVTGYLPSTALDHGDFQIKKVENEAGKMVLKYDSYWEEYEAIGAGKATITIAADNDPNVTYAIEITVEAA